MDGNLYSRGDRSFERAGGVDACGEGPATVATENEDNYGLIGASPAFTKAVRRLRQLARAQATVLVTGETGTGKEVFAEAIHKASPRRDKPFIPVNCGGLPEHLLENELFGHAKGAYTGAGSAGKGLLAEAEGGTLFLDELNSLSMSAQAKLLRFLQSHEYRMLGSTKLMRADVRIIGATNADLRDEVKADRFREDLYHRLFVLSIELPPLRNRLEDVPLLAAHFLGHFARENGRGDVRLGASAEEKLRAYNWPGNVRELQSVVHRSLLLSANNVLTADDVDLEVEGLSAGSADSRAGISSDQSVMDDGMAEHFRDAKARVVKHFEVTYLRGVLNQASGNVTQAAKLSGMQRRDFQRLLRKHEIRG